MLRGVLDPAPIHAAREAFRPVLLKYLRGDPAPNRGTHRHFLPMPFEPPCFAPEFFFNARVLSIVHAAMDDRAVADQWGCDVPVRGSEYQDFHIDYRRPLFAEAPDLSLPAYMLAVSFGLVPITRSNGPIEMAPGNDVSKAEPILLDIGDVLIRNPWTLHRGTPNKTGTPRPLVTIRYVRRWYADDSREVNPIPCSVWRTLTREQQALLRFPVKAE